MKTMRAAVFLDRDGVINVDTNLISKIEDFQIYPFAPKAIQTINQLQYLAIIITNQSAIARGLLTEKGLASIHEYLGEQLAVEQATIDGIYYCPHHPQGNFPNAQVAYITKCSCRKPNDGMLQAAKNDFAIDLRLSWLIGDSERDILAGKKAGVSTIAVQTGHGNKNYDAQPDFFCENLEVAVAIISDPLPGMLWELLQKKRNENRVIHVVGDAFSGKSTLIKNIQRLAQLSGCPTQYVHLEDVHTISPHFLSNLTGGIYENKRSRNNVHWLSKAVLDPVETGVLTFLEYANRTAMNPQQDNINELWVLQTSAKEKRKRQQAWEAWNNNTPLPRVPLFVNQVPINTASFDTIWNIKTDSKEIVPHAQDL